MTIIFKILIAVLFIMIFIGIYYAKATKKIMSRHVQTSTASGLISNPLLQLSFFYFDHKDRLNTREIVVFKRYFMIQIIDISVIIIMAVIFTRNMMH